MGGGVVGNEGDEAGIFSKLEAAGAFSSIEKLLPLADDLKLLSTAEALLNVPAFAITGLALALLVGEYELLTVLPEDLVGTVGLASGAAVVLLAVSALFGLLQGKD